MDVLKKPIVIDLSSMDKFMETVLIKKKDLDDKTPMQYLENLCINAANGNYNKQRMQKIISQRIIGLEDAGVVYIETDEEGCNEDLLAQTVSEIEILKEILQ
jgi:hypothetical protein